MDDMDDDCPECGEAHTGPCETQDDWWLTLPPAKQDRIIAESLAAMGQAPPR